MEVCYVSLDLLNRVTSWVYRNKYRLNDGTVFFFCVQINNCEYIRLSEANVRRTESFDCCTHLVKFFWADIWTVGEAKVDEIPFPEQVFLSKRCAVVGGQCKRSSNIGSSGLLVFKLLLWLAKIASY